MCQNYLAHSCYFVDVVFLGYYMLNINEPTDNKTAEKPENASAAALMVLKTVKKVVIFYLNGTFEER